MDPIMTGALIRRFRTNMHLTQKQLAERIHVSDKTVSKWECGNGCPDVALLSAIAEVFGMDTRVLLSGTIDQNESEKGNMKKIKFYVCPTCGNIITSTSAASVTCCGNHLSALEMRKAGDDEKLRCERIEDEWFISSDHEMTKSHYISFVAYVHDSRVLIVKQYPEWNLQATLPLYRAGKLVWYCNRCGLLYQDI